MRASWIRLLAAVAALIFIAANAAAQLPTPFSGTPDGAGLVYRADVEALRRSSALEPLVRKLGASQKNLSGALMGAVLAEGDASLRASGNSFPGEVLMIEGADYAMTGDNANKQAVVIYGNFEPAKVASWLTSNRWKEKMRHLDKSIFANAAGTWYFTMPNNGTILIATKESLIKSMVDVSQKQARPLSQTESALSSSMQSLGDSPIGVSVLADEPLKQQIMASIMQGFGLDSGEVFIGNPTDQIGAIFDGLNSASISVDTSSALQCVGRANYASYEIAVARAQLLQDMLGALGFFLRMQYAGDPIAESAVDTMAKVRVSAEGNAVSARLPLTSDTLSLLADKVPLLPVG